MTGTVLEVKEETVNYRTVLFLNRCKLQGPPDY